ncbi:CAP domain-containing protein [Pleurocapsa sp. CCALA 161]|uniref:CAP domain-containing protein n=1 Tax=Pleurocapsa sp. CCALA 161 TaxID=2107688 RepID=UPI000D0837B0|nr:CAP domain-containing protein [Pleurocapsa sp. CCALA 161]PSB11896.1 CAP domain-containing protein [Pleurocapsa sp. CCALA 161]
MVNNSDTFDQQILDLVNQERFKVGADPLSINEQLDQAADLHSQDQASLDNMSHTGSNGSDFGTRIQEEGYQFSTAAENVAAGQIDAADVMASWMGSDGHRANILNADFEDIGIGSATGDDGSIYWTQNFGAEIA